MEYRQYQEDAISTVMTAMDKKTAVLLQAPTGSGKAIIFCEIIKRYLEEYPSLKIGIVSHRHKLVTQAMEKLMKVWPSGVNLAGYACASVGKVEVDKRIVIGSIQTLARRVLEEPFDLLIIDEAHRVNFCSDSQYRKLVEKNQELNPGLRILGMTATPYRLNHGFIYGTKCRSGKVNLFTQLDYTIGMNELIEQGYLSQWRAKQPVDIKADLKKIKISNGEYDDNQLTELLIRNRHMKSVVEAYQSYGEERKHCLVFAVTIKHAEALNAFFSEFGYSSGVVHSKMKKDAKESVLKAFEDGEINFLVNVGILTEGWDCPPVDLIILCRPTKSPALFVQMIGRGTRVFPGKKNLLILDMVNNFREHGDPANPVVKYKKSDKTGEALIKVCPNCEEIISLMSKTCPFCGYVFESEVVKTPEINKAPLMEEVRIVEHKLADKVLETLSFSVHTHEVRSVKNAGKKMSVLTIYFKSGKAVSVYLDIEGQINQVNKHRAEMLWKYLTGNSDTPKTVHEMYQRKNEIRLPKKLTVNYKHKFNEINEFNYIGTRLEIKNDNIPVKADIRLVNYGQNT
jgi:DNA repair protein RadD